MQHGSSITDQQIYLLNLNQALPCFLDVVLELLAEFLGTFALISAVILNVVGASPLGVTSIAFTLMVCIYALGDVSGTPYTLRVICFTLYAAC